MITVKRYKDKITISGHAGYAEKGADIVCAGVSALAQTLIESVEALTEDKIEYELLDGKANIKFWTLSERSYVLIESFFIGVELIADKYPYNVEIG